MADGRQQYSFVVLSFLRLLLIEELIQQCSVGWMPKKCSDDGRAPKFTHRLVREYTFLRGRGTAKQWIKEGKQAVKTTRLSCHRFRPNGVRPWLSVIAYSLGNLRRRLGLPQRIKNGSLTSLQQRLVKTGGRFVKLVRSYWLLLA